MICSFRTAPQLAFANLVPEVAVSEAGVGQPGKRADPLGTPHQGDRVALRIGRGFVLHLLAMAVLGESSHHSAAGGLRRRS